MCLALSGKIVAIKDGEAEVDYGGVSKRADLRLFESAKVGDRVLVHAGFVIQILDESDISDADAITKEIMRFG